MNRLARRCKKSEALDRALSNLALAKGARRCDNHRMVDHAQAKAAFYDALDFHEASVRASSNRRTERPLHAPEIVNMALAAELYPKAAVLNVKPLPKKEHQLNELVSWLLPEQQEFIEKDYSGQRNATISRTRKEIAAVASAFVQFRYSHEAYRSIDLFALRLLTQSAFKMVRTFVPEWVVDEKLEETLIDNTFVSGFVIRSDGDKQALLRQMSEALLKVAIAHSSGQRNVLTGEESNLFLAPPMIEKRCSQAGSVVKTVGRIDKGGEQ